MLPDEEVFVGTVVSITSIRDDPWIVVFETTKEKHVFRRRGGVNRLGDNSAFVISAGQLLLTRRGKTRIYTVGIVF